jgi:tetratricopeptide (TPR) repeat protein
VTNKNADPRYARNLSIAANNLSYVLAKSDPKAAERAMREAVRILEQLSAADPDNNGYQDDLALCFNNLAALLSRTDRAAEAIPWHIRAAGLQEQLVRRSPSVVRHRSDLAISLNNLGVAYCRAGQVDAADEPFTEARELFATLVSDYPNELGYESAYAGLLNNQALALAGVQRHDSAANLYEEAINAQRRCYRRAPSSKMVQEMLSKMIYNQGRSLAALQRWDAAADAAISRRELWQNDGRRLFGVAVELAGIGSANSNSDDAELKEKINRETISTLREAFDHGYPRERALVADKRFAHLSNNIQFTDLLSQQKP